jgi:hypothetical protein
MQHSTQKKQLQKSSNAISVNVSTEQMLNISTFLMRYTFGRVKPWSRYVLSSEISLSASFLSFVSFLMTTSRVLWTWFNCKSCTLCKLASTIRGSRIITWPERDSKTYSMHNICVHSTGIHTITFQIKWLLITMHYVTITITCSNTLRKIISSIRK